MLECVEEQEIGAVGDDAREVSACAVAVLFVVDDFPLGLFLLVLFCLDRWGESHFSPSDNSPVLKRGTDVQDRRRRPAG